VEWPQQARVVQQTTRNATSIRKGFNEAFDTDAIVTAWFDSHPDKDSMTPQGARDWTLAHVHAKRKPLELALATTYATGWSLGQATGKGRILAMVANKGVTATSVDWSNWTPGMEPAAALVRPPGGLKRLLDSRKITIADDIIHTKLDRIGTSLARGLEQGYGPRETAKMINEVINDPQHALMIARTETIRALSIANREEYEKANVELVEWVVAEGCEDCQENADASPIGIGDTFPSGDSEPPAHPNCVCALAPAFDDSLLPPAEEPMAEDGSPMEEAGAESLDTSNAVDEVYEEVDDIRADELARYQNYDYALTEMLGIQRNENGTWIQESLTAEGTAVRKYKLIDYADINRLLREGKQPLGREAKEKVPEYIKSLDKVMKVAPGLPSPIMTFRGVDGDVLSKFLGSLGKGDVFADKGFMSTSMFKDFSKDWVASVKENKYLIEVENPAGTKGLMLDGLKSNSAAIEAEWLLPRDTQFEVVSNDTINNILRVRVKNG